MGHQAKLSKIDQNKYLSPGKLKRDIRTRKDRFRYLIVCEGEKTEPYYFEALKKHLPKGIVDVDIIGAGAETLRIVQIAKTKYLKSQRSANPYDKVWVVFDRDSFPPADFDNAVHSAEANKFGSAWSNEAFELWYLLHFEFRNTGMSRKKYKSALSSHLGEEYKKNDSDMYRKLKNHQEQAIRNAARLLAQHIGTTPSQSNPATQVHLLVKELNEYRVL